LNKDDGTIDTNNTAESFSMAFSMHCGI